METGQETDDGDPYVCFRRREVRQARKTRGRDAQSIEKLRKLRRELEDARALIALVKQRELTKGELLKMERTLFDQRMKFKETKRKLNIKNDDEDLINQKVSLSFGGLAGSNIVAKSIRLIFAASAPEEQACATDTSPASFRSSDTSILSCGRSPGRDGSACAAAGHSPR